MFKTIKLAAVFFLSFYFSVAHAQDKKTDSLKAVLANTKISDTVRINTIIEGIDHSIMLSKEHVAFYNQLPPIFSKGLKLQNLHPKVKRKYLNVAGAKVGFEIPYICEN